MGSYYNGSEKGVRKFQSYKLNSRGKNRVREIELLTSGLRVILNIRQTGGEMSFFYVSVQIDISAIR